MSGFFVDRAAHRSRWRDAAVGPKAALAGTLVLGGLLAPAFPWAIAVGLLSVAIALVGARVAPSDLGRFLALPLSFTLLGGLPLLLSTEGGLSLAPGGAALLGRTVARSAAVTAGVALFALTTPVGAALEWLRRRGLAPALADVAWTAYVFLFVLADTASALLRAQAARLGRADAWSRVRSSGLLVAALLARAFARAERMERGLLARQVGEP